MFNVSGKNVVVVGGLHGVCLTLTKTLLKKGVNKLVIVDTNENQSAFHELKTKYENSMIYFERLDDIYCEAGEIDNIIRNILNKMQCIDVWINGMEVMLPNDLQRTMTINTQVYLTYMMLAREAMDKTKGGNGGVIVNLLSNLGMEAFENHHFNSTFYAQQYFINKQMLMSMTKTFSQELFHQQTGVSVLCLMPVISEKLFNKSSEWINKTGFQNFITELKAVSGHQHSGHLLSAWINEEDDEFYNFNRKSLKNRTGAWGDECEEFEFQGQDKYEFFQSAKYQKYWDVLGHHMIRAIENCRNGTMYVIGFEGVKNIQLGYFSRYETSSYGPMFTARYERNQPMYYGARYERNQPRYAAARYEDAFQQAKFYRF